jgi:hypothetical protein
MRLRRGGRLAEGLARALDKLICTRAQKLIRFESWHHTLTGSRANSSAGTKNPHAYKFYDEHCELKALHGLCPLSAAAFIRLRRELWWMSECERASRACVCICDTLCRSIVIL